MQRAGKYEINRLSTRLTKVNMKTKAIFVSLLMMLLCFGANLNNGNLGQCLCPPEVSSPSQVVSVIANAISDICNDCGHTTNCCFSHKKIPFVGSVTLSQIEFQADLPTAIPSFSLPASIASSTLAKSGVNKAPPWSRAETLVSLHQQLLI